MHCKHWSYLPGERSRGGADYTRKVHTMGFEILCYTHFHDHQCFNLTPVILHKPAKITTFILNFIIKGIDF